MSEQKMSPEELNAESLRLTGLIDKASEAGLRGGRRNVEASVILDADARASEKTGQSDGSRLGSHRRQENLLEQYAKRNDIWFKQGQFPDRLYIGKGGEANVYQKDATRVVKLIDYRHIDKSMTPQKFIDNRISLFNHLFPESHYELMGVMRDDNGTFRFIVTQPFIQGSEIKSQAEVDQWFDKRGLDRTGRESYSNDLYEAHDLHIGNVLKDANGNIYVIDAVPKAKQVQPFTVVRPDEALRSVADTPFYSRVESVIRDKMPNKATSAQVTALLAKNSVKELDPEFQALKVYLDDQGSVSKDDVLAFVGANKTAVSEVVKGGGRDGAEIAEVGGTTRAVLMKKSRGRI